MNGARVNIVDAIVRLDCPAGEYSSAHGQVASATRRADNVGEISSAGPAGEYSSAQGHVDSAGQSASSGDVGMIMVAYDANNSPAVSKRKLGRKWMKLARKAYMRSNLPQRVRNAVEEALREYPDAAILKVREVVESKIGVGLHGKYGVLFDKALLRATAKPEKSHRPRNRFVLRVGRRRAKGAPANA